MKPKQGRMGMKGGTDATVRAPESCPDPHTDSAVQSAGRLPALLSELNLKLALERKSPGKCSV